MTEWSDLWHATTTAVLLGTERRAVPDPFVGDDATTAAVAVGDTVLDVETHRPVPHRGEPDPARRAMRLLAAGTVAQRAGLRPAPALDPCRVTDTDPRPVVDGAAVAAWHRIRLDWPVLDEEFVVRVLASGRRLPPDLVPSMLQRWRSAPLAHARVRAAAGPLADWLIELSPGLAARGRRAVDADLTTLAPLPLTDALAAAVEALEGTPRDVAPLVRAVCNATYAERIVVANAVRMLSAAALEALLGALAPRRGEPLTPGLAPAATDLAALRLGLMRTLPPLTQTPSFSVDQEGPHR